jgi:ADP-ribose pyrophosphatase YjhB (NUDIX family)
MHQNDVFRYCPVCGADLQSVKLKAHEPMRLVCAACHFVFYLDPKLAALSVVEMDGEIVVLKRGIEPQRGKWILPGGFVDRGEEVKAAAVRETEEECGVRTRIKDLLGVYSYPGVMVVIVAYVAEFVSGNLIAGDETEAVRLIRPTEIPWDELAFQSTIDALKDYCHLKDVGD